MRDLFRAIPSVDKCLKELIASDPSLADAPKDYLTYIINSFWRGIREAIARGEIKDGVDLESRADKLPVFVRDALRPTLRRVINGAGVIIHTNLGRSVLAKEAVDALTIVASGYSNLEMDLDKGARGSRHSLVAGLIRYLTGAEDAMVVNNNAAAVLLVLDTLCAGGETIVSRGELVEIGGSFRIPDIMRKSGSILKEVGATNRARPSDYREAINEDTRAIMRAHSSNFRIIGYHSAVSLKELKSIAAEHGLPLIYDMGSGAMLKFRERGIADEPVVKDAIADGADIVCFSGDKVLGGPQAGIIAGKAELVEKLKKNPLARALRCDKLCLAALEATLRLYLDSELAEKAAPTVAMLNMSSEELAKKARALARSLRAAFARAGVACYVSLLKDTSRAGGGSFPEEELPTTLVSLKPEKIDAAELRRRLLKTDPPLMGRLEKDAFCIDPRALFKKDYPDLAKVLLAALA